MQSVHEDIIEGEPPLKSEAEIDECRLQFKVSRLDAKRRLKFQQVRVKEQSLRDKKAALNVSTEATDKQLCKRFKRSLHSITKATGRERQRSIQGNRRVQRRGRSPKLIS